MTKKLPEEMQSNPPVDNKTARFSRLPGDPKEVEEALEGKDRAQGEHWHP